jgi:hypothetical protein
MPPASGATPVQPLPAQPAPDPSTGPASTTAASVHP